MRTKLHNEDYPELWGSPLLEYSDSRFASLLPHVPAACPWIAACVRGDEEICSRWQSDDEFGFASACRQYFKSFAPESLVVFEGQAWIHMKPKLRMRASQPMSILIGEPPSSETVLAFASALASEAASSFVRCFFGLREDLPWMGGYFLPSTESGGPVYLSSLFQESAGLTNWHEGVVLFREMNSTFLVAEPKSERLSWVLVPENRLATVGHELKSVVSRYFGQASFSYYSRT